jgi:D-alanyl-D-alanine carboxypeptidase/D-alanyl-D-alanine-endopeptidase (penicillin-binding protein 4)
MLQVSDNDLAESLGRAVAVRSASSATFAGESAAVTAAVRRLGVDLAGVRLVDASGLSRLDRMTPEALVQILRLALGDARPELRPLVQGLPVAGFSGTLGDRYRTRRSAAAAGVARAKTGTLLGVNALAGYVVDRDGRMLVFAFVTDHAVGVDPTETALDRVVARLAGCGCS